MTESGQAGAPAADLPQGLDTGVLLEAMRARGAQRFDPVGFRFIEVLAGRAAAHGDHAGRVLERRLTRALAEYGERFERAEGEARDTLARARARFPQAVDALRQRFEAGDFGGLHRLVARLEAQGGSEPLAGLLDHIGRRTPADPAGGGAVEPQGELKSLRYFRSTWSRLSVDRQLSHALAQAPENAGPLNSHFLVLQSLTRMRDIAPAYLEQFVSYVDALLWLDQADSGRNPTQKAAVRGERKRKRKSARDEAG